MKINLVSYKALLETVSQHNTIMVPAIMVNTCEVEKKISSGTTPMVLNLSLATSVSFEGFYLTTKELETHLVSCGVGKRASKVQPVYRIVTPSYAMCFIPFKIRGV